MRGIREILSYLKNFVREFPFKKWWVLGFSTFIFLFFTLISFYKNFPAEVIMGRVNDVLSPFRIEIISEDAKITFPFKLKLLSPVIYYKNKKHLSSTEIGMRIYPLRYLFGRKSAKVKVYTEDGSAEFGFTLSGKNFDFKVKAKNFGYDGRIEMPLYQLSYRLFLNGNFEGRINTEDISSADMKGEVQIKNFVVKNISLGNVEVNDIKIGDMASKLSIKNGVLSIGDVPFKSSDVEGNLNLEIVLSRKLTLSRLRGNLSLKFGFRLRQMMESMNLPLQTFLKDGNRIEMKIGGTTGNPSFSLM